MKVSVITACYNSTATIEDAIRSVLSQNYHDIEYIIIDGKSTDDTVEIIRKYESKISKIISEPDNGIYDAINKGIKSATGDVVGFLHSDDFFSDENVLSKIAGKFKKSEADAVYSDLEYVYREDIHKIFRHWKSGNYTQGMFLKGWMPPHPTFYVKRVVYEKHGFYNTDFKISADYELMLRFIHKHQIKIAYIPEVLTKMRVGGKSNRSIFNRLKANKEDRMAWKINGLKPAPFTAFLKPLSKINQFLQKG